MEGAPFLLYEAVDRAAARRPDGVIFRCDEQALTYADFAARSNRLARMLRAQGVRRGDRVGIYLHKSMESGIALYGIMKAGAAYVPLDPGLPVSRLAFVLRDCGIRHVISERRLLPALAEAAAEPGVTLDCVVGPAGSPDRPTPWRSVSWADVAALDGASPPDNRGLIDDDLAYVMYTSGSTGTPKGLIHTHRSGLSYARMAARVYDVGPDDVLSNHSPLHFDMSTFDFFSGPLRGATTVIIPEPYMKLPASLSELMEEERITIWYSVTTALVELLLRGALDHRDLSALRWVNFGGEVFPPKHLRALMALLPHARFSNVYGPAEVNQCTFFHVPPLPNEFGETPVPIGRPWALADGLVVGPDDRPVAPGEPGELLIASPTRMQGYWNRPDLTERGFYRQQPFPGSPYEKIYYRTGDLVQDPGDGELRFLGRKDRQVKIRGFRVELDEVETTLAAHPAVAEAAVYTLSGDDGEQQLEAAVILRAGASAGPDDLLAHLARHLPSYAVPATLLLRDAFPRTGSGKLNRRALQALSLQERGRKESET